jgi:hypothetical protein
MKKSTIHLSFLAHVTRTACGGKGGVTDTPEGTGEWVRDEEDQVFGGYGGRGGGDAASARLYTRMDRSISLDSLIECAT